MSPSRPPLVVQTVQPVARQCQASKNQPQPSMPLELLPRVARSCRSCAMSYSWQPVRQTHGGQVLAAMIYLGCRRPHCEALHL